MKAKLTLALAVVTLSSCLCLKAQIQESDSLALVAFANGTNQPSWNVSTNWLAGPVDTWFGINVTGNRVTGIDLPFNNLLGDIPLEIGDLDALQNVNLNGNLLFSVPDEIGSLIQLEELNLGNNAIGGELPASIGSLTNLRELDVSSNNLFGLLNISSLTQLETLNIANNSYRTLPSLTGFSSLTSVFVENNFFEFDDLEPNVGIPGISYIPQRLVSNDQTVLLDEEGVTFGVSIGGSANTYQWFRGSEEIPGETNDFINLPVGAASDRESYFYQSVNPLVPGLTLSTGLFIVVENTFNTAYDSISSNFTFNQLSSVNDVNHFRMSLNVGDVNNDGLDDLGILLLDRFLIFFGGPFHQTPDIVIPTIPDYTMREVRSADYNNDGFSDIAISSINLDDPSNLSQIDFYFGSELLDVNVDLTISITDLTALANTSLGFSFNNIGDANDDGVEDFLVSVNGESELYLFFGGPSLSSTPSQILTGYDTDFGFSGLQPFANLLGARINGLGDVNGDGIDDFAVSDIFRSYDSPLGFFTAGIVIIHFGNPAGTIQPDLVLLLDDASFASINVFGLNIMPAKVNDDSYNDIIVNSVFSRDDFLPGNGREQVFVFYGGPGIDNTVDLALRIPAFPLGADGILTLPTFVGELVTVPDVTGDGKEEIIFGSQAGSILTTNALLIESEDFGSDANTPSTVLEAPNPDFYLGANNNDSFFQKSSAVGDFNNDGILEVILNQPADTTTFTSAYVFPIGFSQVPSIIGQPQDLTVCENNSAFFTVNASGSGLTYQWQISTDGGVSFADLLEEAPYSNVTDSTLTIDSVSSSLDGSQYRCIVAGTLTSMSATLSVDPGNYAIQSQDILCSDPKFFIPIETINPVSSEVLGLDFCVQYDETKITPTGNAILSDVVHGGDPSFADYSINISTPGQLNGIIFYTSSAPFPTFLSGQGLVIEIEFKTEASFELGDSAEIFLCGVSESTLASGTIDHCDETVSEVRSTNDPVFSGVLKYWDRNGRRLQYDESNPSAFIPTIITGVDSDCNPIGGSQIFPDLDGAFTFETLGDSFEISRDIPGSFVDNSACTNVMNWINGADQNRAMKIATLDSSFIPNVYQIIAADVNQDGVVNAGDVTLIAARSVMSICGFPSTSTEKDWLFVDQGTLDSSSSFVISDLYPLEDGLGYSKNQVPSVPSCFPVPSEVPGDCVADVVEDYVAILLGDVSGNWRSADGANLRGSGLELSFQFNEVIKEGQDYLLPLTLTDEITVESLDLFFNFDDEKMSVQAVESSIEGLNQVSNIHGGDTYLFSSYLMTPKLMSGKILYLRIKSSIELVSQDISNIEAFLNGNKVDIGGSEILSIEDIENTNYAVYPNPFHERITLEYRGDHLAEGFEFKMLDAAGQEVLPEKKRVVLDNKVELDVAHLSSGIYFLKILDSENDLTIKIVK